MISVDEALDIILASAEPPESETIGLDALVGRIGAEDIKAQMTQPPFAASAMDGYAVRFADMAIGARLKVIGEAPAGAPFAGRVEAGQAIRVFTGAAMPDGADHVVIQEDVARSADEIEVKEAQEKPRHIRPSGIDFTTGDVLVRAGTRFHEIHSSLLAAANLSSAVVRRRPRVAIFSNGDELVDPGDALKPGQIVNSNHYALSALVKNWGGAADYLGCAPDEENAIRAFFKKGEGYDVVVPVGGASVGEYDFVKSAFRAEGGEIKFEKIAVKPGKPTWFGLLGGARIIGLPGNPASAIVTAALFLQPLVKILCGASDQATIFEKVRLGAPLGPNGGRESYLRAVVAHSDKGFVATPAANQDSSLLSPFAEANALIRRLPRAGAVDAGGDVEALFLP